MPTSQRKRWRSAIFKMEDKTWQTKKQSIEELRDKYKVSDAMFEGVKAAKKWKSGRQVEENEFTKAVEDFKTAPIDGRREEAKG